MSSSDTTTGSGLRSDMILLGLVLAAGLALLFYFASQSQTVLRKSTVGFEGLRVWLNAQGQPARSFTGGWNIDPDTVGLLVQPSFDPRPTHRREPPRSKEELLMQQEEYDLRVSTLLGRSRKVTSLVILPKWRSGMRLTGLAHPILLDIERGPRGIASHLLNEDAVELARIPEPFVDFDYTAGGETLTARLYVPQVISSDKCSPIIGTRDAMVLGWCDGYRSGFYLLSDPDLFNNHGLRLGDNALIARHFVELISEGREVVIDYSARDWLLTGSSDAADEYERSWEDLKRFFGPPFLALWIGGGVLMALALWRGGLRFGPLIAAEGGPGTGSAKAEAIRARARLMRLTDQDGALVADYARTRVASLGVRLFGPAHGMDDRTLHRQIAAAFPAAHAALDRALADIRALPAKTAPGEALAHVNALERVLEKFET